jgi:DNA recombination protein RmuC
VALSLAQALIACAVVGLVVLVVLVLLLARAARERRSEAAAEAIRASRTDQRIETLARIQAETVGRLHAVGDTLTGRQAELGRVLRVRPKTSSWIAKLSQH